MSLTIDYQKKSITGLKADNQASDFSPASAGRIFYNTTDSKLKVDTGSVILIVAASTTSLTSGRVPIVGTAGVLSDDAGLLYSTGTSTLTATNVTVSTTLKADTQLPTTTSGTIVHKSDGGISVQAGDATEGVIIRTLHVNTTNATQTQMTFDGAAPSASNIPLIANSSAHLYMVMIKALNTSTNVGEAAFVITAFIHRTGGTTSLLGGLDKVILYQADVNVDATITADTTRNGIAVQVTGLAATNMTWIAEVREIR